MPVTCVRLKRLKASASSSKRTSSLIWKRREMRMSRYQMFGCLKKLRRRPPKRFAPPAPLTPPAGVEQVPVPTPLQAEPVKPNEAGEIAPETLPVARAPEKALKMGANVQPLKMARPTLLSFRLAKSVL